MGEPDISAVVARLREAGCVAAEEEAQELVDAATPGRSLDEMVARRCAGEPLAWVTGSISFCDVVVLVHPGVFVPRKQSEPLALEAVARLPDDGIAVDLCTGAGALALVMSRRKPGATVLGTEVDPVAVACAQANGVAVLAGDMAAPLPATLAGRVDVVTGVVPYVPTGAMGLLPRDSAYEPVVALDGGVEGTMLLRRAVSAASGLLRAGGSLLLEVGADQDLRLAPVLDRHGFRDVEAVADEDGDLRALYCRRRP